MSGFVTLPQTARPDGLPAGFQPIAGGQITAISLDVPGPAPIGGLGWVTGFSVGGLINPNSATLTGSVSGTKVLSQWNGFSNFSVDQAGNFAFQIAVTGNLEIFTLTQNGVSSTNPALNSLWNSAWSPVNLASPAGIGCLFWFDPQNPTAVLLADTPDSGLSTANTPNVSAIVNLAAPNQIMRAYPGLDAFNRPTVFPQWSRRLATRAIKMTQNINTTPFQLVANWFGAIKGDGCGLENLINLFQSGPNINPRTIVMGVYNSEIASQVYFNAMIAQEIPAVADAYEQIRANFGSGDPIAYNPAWTTTGIVGNSTAVSNNTAYTLTATMAANGAAVFRVNGAQTGAGTLTPIVRALNPVMIGLGVNNLPVGNSPPSNYPNGVPPAVIGSVLIFSGVLAAGDITSAEAWVGRSLS